MPRQYRKYSDDDIRKNAQTVKTMGELLRSLGLRPAGGNFNNIRRKLQQLQIDCSHWESDERRAWNKGKQLKDWSDYSKIDSLKPHLIKERSHQCERCKLTEWQNEIIPLEVEHSNGDRTDNRKENLKLLCCNCHALTPTWRGRNSKIR